MKRFILIITKISPDEVKTPDRSSRRGRRTSLRFMAMHRFEKCARGHNVATSKIYFNSLVLGFVHGYGFSR